MKKLIILLSLLFLIQSCNVYRSASITPEEAVAAEKKVRIITTDGEKYKFTRLEKEYDRLIGMTKMRSATAKKLAKKIIQTDGRWSKIDLSRLAIDEINLRNNTQSTIQYIAVFSLVGYLALLAIYLLIGGPVAGGFQ